MSAASIFTNSNVIDNLVDARAVLAFRVPVSDPPALGLGIRQVETLAITVTSVVPGVLVVTVTASGMSNSPKAVNVTLAGSETDAQVAALIRAALTADSDANGFFAISGTGTSAIGTATEPAANDPTMSFAVAASHGVNAATSMNTTAGVASDLDIILERARLGGVWAAGTTYNHGDMVIPTETHRTGRRYVAISDRSGVSSQISGSAEPLWAAYQSGRIGDGGVLWVEDGPEIDLWDLRFAEHLAWARKADLSASCFDVAVQGNSFKASQVYDHCVKQAAAKAPLVIA